MSRPEAIWWDWRNAFPTRYGGGRRRIYGAFDLEALTVAKGRVSTGFRDFLGISDVREHSRAVMREASASNYVKPGLPPFQPIHGTADEAVSYDRSARFCTRLKASGNAAISIRLRMKSTA